MSVQIRQLVLGPVSTNCYLVSDPETGRCVIVDPADNAKRIETSCRNLELKPEAILLTHGHFDHIHAANELRELLGVPVIASEAERRVLLDPMLNGSMSFMGDRDSVKADRYLADGEEFDAAGTTFRLIHTPGHTEGSCCYYMEEEKILLAGDTLFYTSYGRCDLPTGSMHTIAASIREKLFTLPEETAVLPGHGEMTTIGFEKSNNPLA